MLEIDKILSDEQLYKNNKFQNINWAKTKQYKADKDPYYHTKISIFSFTWADLAAFHKSDKI